MFFSLGIQSEYLTLLSVNEKGIQAAGIRKLNRAFSMDSIRTQESFFAMIGDAFNSLVGEFVGKSGDIGISLYNPMVMIKKIPIALGLGDELIQQQMHWETQQFLLSPLDEYVITHQRLPYQTPSGNPFYLQVLVRRQIIKLLKEIVASKGMKLKEIDVDLFSCVRAVLSNYDLNPLGTTALIEVQKDHLIFIFIHQNEYFLSNRISLKIDPKQKSQSHIEINKILIKELRRFIFGHRLGKGIEDLDNVFLMGDYVIKDILQELKSTIRTEIVNPFRRLRMESVVSQSEMLTQYPEKFTASVGLAIKKVPALLTDH